MCKVGAAFLGIVLVFGCAKPHVTLAPPPPNLTPEQRVHAFNALRAAAAETKITTYCGRNGCSETIDQTLILANGQSIHHPADLLPVLPSDSEAAAAVRGVERAKSRQLQWALGGAACFLGAAAWWSQSDSDYGWSSSGKVVVGVLLVGTVLGAGGAWYYQGVANREIRRSYHAYTKGLADRLGICVSGLAIVPCEQPAAP